jgi:hypothetical protein
MTSSKRQPHVASGPWGWENSQAKLKGKPQLGTIEIGCYTDLPDRRMDSVRVGPYTVLMPWSLRELEFRTKAPRLGVVIRVEQYLGEYPDEYVDPSWEQLDPRNYHGAVAWEELAALVSLALGLRLRAGGIQRVFGPEIDELGYPHEMDSPPYLPGPTRYWPMLPGMSDYDRDVDFSRLNLLDAYPHMSVSQARALVRAARSYQDAIWIADGDPRQAWLRLVAAVEIVAELQPSLPAQQRLRAVYPDMADQILGCGNPELVEWFTKKVADRERAQARFLAFLQKFGPPRPRRRPGTSSGKQDWRALDRQLRRIYQARSDDLHKGSPIPKAMCEAPYVSSRGIAPEVTWSSSAEEPRLRLHVFEYIVRSALLSWWRSTGNPPTVP